MPSDETRGRVLEIIVVAQLSAILVAVMLYYFIHPPQAQCRTQSPPLTEKSAPL